MTDPLTSAVCDCWDEHFDPDLKVWVEWPRTACCPCGDNGPSAKAEENSAEYYRGLGLGTPRS